ncbi:hypothetical protein J3T91_01115 [Bifidobacterium sp. B4001]|uniref:hypothetical protein n=1 Tax=Bifidobacterium sp. B4001 TaxID=2817961 RepID=UPI002A13414F|nr:hypothetical protein [Bifidobacterium sp. B4079]MCX8680556.1 hypothetical protein [Bifidobacterium sp. B4001]
MVWYRRAHRDIPTHVDGGYLSQAERLAQAGLAKGLFLRVVPDHWKGGPIMGSNNRSVIDTTAEHSTRFIILLHLPAGLMHTAQPVSDEHAGCSLWKKRAM